MEKLAIFTLLLVLAGHYFPSPSAANENNLLFTGDALRKDEQLSNSAGATFVLQNDCNLVLYNKAGGFVSNTFSQGSDCRLSLNDRGQLLIRSGSGSLLWTSGPRSQQGKYAAVLRPDGQVAVYGPSVWSTPDFGFDTSSDDASSAVGARMQTIPAARNVLFSDQEPYYNVKLATRDYTFVLRSDCNLVLTKAVSGDIWSSGTAGKGKNCSVWLNGSGLLGLEDGRPRKIWGSGAAASKQGDYALILQINGQAVIYGPVIWSTSSS